MNQYICEVCETEFEAYRKTAKYCSQKCMGVAISGENHPHYKGGTIDKYGYRRIHVDCKKVLEHRYVMEVHLGRKLELWEEVHHEDENKLNNNIDNLILTTNAEHRKLYHSSFRNEESKQCTKCLEIKSRAEFYLQKSNIKNYDKNHSRCKDCFNECRYKQNQARKIN